MVARIRAHDFMRRVQIKEKKKASKQQMTHSAIYDSIHEIVQQLAKFSGEEKVNNLAGYIKSKTPGSAFTLEVRETISPIQTHITAKNIPEIARHFPNFPVERMFAKIPQQELDKLWQAAGLTNMLLTTIQMVPNEMMEKIESMTSSMMNAMQGKNAGGFEQLMRSMMPALAPATESGSDEEEPPRRRTKKHKANKSKQDAFREKLC